MSEEPAVIDLSPAIIDQIQKLGPLSPLTDVLVVHGMHGDRTVLREIAKVTGCTIIIIPDGLTLDIMPKADLAQLLKTLTK